MYILLTRKYEIASPPSAARNDYVGLPRPDPPRRVPWRDRTGKIAVFVSGNGSNLQALIESVKKGTIKWKIGLVVSNNKDAYALTRAKKNGIETLALDPMDFNRAARELKKRKIKLICLAGFLLKLPPQFVRKFKNKIINIHPALLPAFGGKGMYGLNVHRAVLASGQNVSGCTVHFVDEEYDHGKIILQKKVPVLEGDTPETLAKRVLKHEHKIYPLAVKYFCERSVIIKND
ncbi:MAG: phosphoribosylglycinamide formyltransferase [Elusimicrobiota bacterium]